MQIAQRGDRRAFDRLAREQQDWLYNLAYRLTGDARAASVAVEQTLAQAWRDLPGSGCGPVQVWLARIAVQACCAELDRRGDPPVMVTAPAANSAPPDGGRPSPEYPLSDGATEEQIQRCLDRLPLEERTALVLVDILGLDYAEAAQVTGRPASTVTRRLARARVRLGELLKAGA